MNVNDLPAVNATLNALSTLFILAGWVMIRTERKVAHALCMASALVTSAAFLACYLVYHYLKAGHVTHFTYPGWPKALYFFILGTHTPLAIIALPLLALTVIPAIRQRFDAHKRMARWTLPVWLYVSVTGVLVYFMLYVWFPSGKI
jgi:putative membrane protein